MRQNRSGNRQRVSGVGCIILLLCLLLSACKPGTINISLGGNGTDTAGGNTTAVGSGAQGLKVVVEPDGGDQFLVDAIENANTSVMLEMYLLTDKKIITALEDAANNGKDVRVMLEKHPYGGGSISPTQTLDTLQAAGVKTEATSPQFTLTHEKGMVIDNKTAYIMTSNMTLAALGQSKSQNNREYAIIDTNQQDVQTVSDIFNADWQRKQVTLNDPNLVVSPINSRTDFLSLINGARKTLSVEAEEMQDQQTEQALISTARRGVQVEVILPKTNTGDSSSNSSGINSIQQGGVAVKVDRHLYMHAKIFIVDGQKGFVGSENISKTSLDQNRELGILISDQSVLTTLQQTFQQDWSGSQAA